MPVPSGDVVDYVGNYVSLPVNMLKAPTEGNRAVPIGWLWQQGGAEPPAYVVHFNAANQRVLPISQICALHLNNLHSSVPITILFPDTNFEIQLGPNLEGYYPVTTNALEFFAYCTLLPTASDRVQIEVLNFLPPPLIFGANPGGVPVGVVTEVDTGPGLTGGPITSAGTISLAIPVTIADGGTNATSPNGALDALSGSSGSTVGLLTRNAAGQWLLSPLGSGGNPPLPLTVVNGGTGETTGFLALDNLAGVSGQTGVLSRANTGVWSLAPATGTGTITGVLPGVGLVGGGTTGSVTLGLGTPVAVANGGTGAGTGDLALDSLAGVTGSANGFLSRGGGGAWALTATPLAIAAGGTGQATAAAALAALGGAPIANAVLTGAPASTTPTAGDNSTRIATTAFVDGAVAAAPFLPLSGGNLSGSLGVVGTGNFAVSTAGQVSISGPANGFNIFDRNNPANEWSLFSSGNNFEWAFNNGGALMSLTPAGVLNIPNEVIIGPGNQTTSQLVNINGNASPVQISAVSNSALNVRIDNAAALLYFLFQSTTNVGTISTNGSSVAYNTTSDGRLKENVEDYAPDAACAVLDALQAVEFDWRGGGHDIGFIAQAVEPLYPHAVTIGRGEPETPDFRPWQMDPAKLVPVLVTALQDTRRHLAELASTVEALAQAVHPPTRREPDPPRNRK